MMLLTVQLFSILKKNMFNALDKEPGTCENHESGTSYMGDHSYIRSVKWDKFMGNISYQLNKTIELRDRINEFTITKKI